MISELQIGDYDFQQFMLGVQRFGAYWEKIPETNLVKISFQGHVEYFEIGGDLPHIRLGHERIIEDKFHLKKVFAQHHVPTLKAEIVHSIVSIEEVLSYLRSRIAWPVVIKPPHARCGDAVFCAIADETEFRAIWHQHIEKGPKSYYLVEECWPYCPDYRFIFFRGETPFVVKRTVPTVCGDGLHTIEELVTIENKKRVHAKRNCLCDIVLFDPDGMRCLQHQGLTKDFIPVKDVQVNLRYNTNLSYGGMAEVIDFSMFHSSYYDLLHQVWSLFPKLPFLSFDILSFDITKPIYEYGSMAVSEAHITPGIGMFLAPSRGHAVDVLTPMILTLFPEMRQQ